MCLYLNAANIHRILQNVKNSLDENIIKVQLIES